MSDGSIDTNMEIHDQLVQNAENCMKNLSVVAFKGLRRLPYFSRHENSAISVEK